MADIRKIRNFVRARKNELEILGDFDEWLTKITNLEAHVKGLEGQAAEAAKVKADADDYLKKQKAAAKKAWDDANAKIAAAEEKADEIDTNAQRVKAEADATLARAQAEAVDIEAAGREHLKALEAGEKGNLKKIKDDIKAQQGIKAGLEMEIDRLKERKATIEREIERIRAL